MKWIAHILVVLILATPVLSLAHSHVGLQNAGDTSSIAVNNQGQLPVDALLNSGSDHCGHMSAHFGEMLFNSYPNIAFTDGATINCLYLMPYQDTYLDTPFQPPKPRLN